MKKIPFNGRDICYYIYKGYFIWKEKETGYYVAYAGMRLLTADTQAGMKRLVNKAISACK